ncbi:MAG: GTPase Era [Anaerolineae bacterium]
MSGKDTGESYSSESIWPPGHRSGFVAVVGSPNVGKSTLINTLLEHKLAIVSPKPQTTRHRLLAILTRENAQIIFIDTPGLHQPLHLLGQYMVESASEALAEADAILWLVDATHEPTDEDKFVTTALAKADTAPVALLINKTDAVSGEVLAERQKQYLVLHETAAAFLISAITGKGLDRVLLWLLDNLLEGPRYYPEDQKSLVTEGESSRREA